jgi:hypothetical protein
MVLINVLSQKWNKKPFRITAMLLQAFWEPSKEILKIKKPSRKDDF